ncbi:hypothetical protein Hanom_Chr15g01381971 [Helianthus anomalus]
MLVWIRGATRFVFWIFHADDSEQKMHPIPSNHHYLHCDAFYNNHHECCHHDHKHEHDHVDDDWLFHHAWKKQCTWSNLIHYCYTHDQQLQGIWRTPFE